MDLEPAEEEEVDKVTEDMVEMVFRTRTRTRSCSSSTSTFKTWHQKLIVS